MNKLLEQTATAILKKDLFNVNDINLIARCLFDLILSNRLSFHGIASSSYLGDSIVNEIIRITSNPRIFFTISLNKKMVTTNKYKITPMNDFHSISNQVLLVDYLVAHADTKLEAIKALNSIDQKVVGLVALIDHERYGDKEKLEEAGCPVHSVFNIDQLLIHHFKLIETNKKNIKNV